MGYKRKIMLASYYAPGVVAGLRAIFTIWFLFWNPFNMELVIFQIVPLLVLIAFTFLYFKMYRDSVPIVSLLLPTLLQGVLIFIFKRTITLFPFVVVLTLDASYLACKGLKATFFPFVLDGQDVKDFDFDMGGVT